MDEDMDFKKLLPILIIIGVLIILPLTYLLTQTRQEIRQKAAVNTTLVLSNSLTRSPLKNETFDVKVDLVIPPNTTNVAGSEVAVTFDKNIFRAVQISTPSGTFVHHLEFPTIDNTNGTASFTVLFDPLKPATQSGTLAFLKLTALNQTSSTQIAFGAPPATNVVGVGGTDTGKNVLQSTQNLNLAVV